MRKTSINLTLLSVVIGQSAMAIEEPRYTVLLTTKHYEIRRYDPYIVAEVDVGGDFRRAGNRAFRVLADYIFGDNEPREKMTMTVPAESSEGVRMNMTAPVTSRQNDAASRFTYAFVMERKYTMDTLPQPTSPHIRISERPARTMAVRRYAGTWHEQRYRNQESALLEALAGDRVETIGVPIFARYNSPFTPWFLRRNEVMIEVDWPGPSAPLR